MMASEDNKADKDLVEPKKAENNIEQKKDNLLKELKEQIRTVDVNMSALATSFNSLYDRFIKHSHDVETMTDSQNWDMEKCREYFEGKHECTSTLNNAKTEQTEVVESLRKLLHYIHADSGDICTHTIPDKCELEIDCLQDKEKSDAVDAWVKMLQGENERLRARNNLYREHAALVNKRAELVCAERDRLRDENVVLQKKILQNKFEVSDQLSNKQKCETKDMPSASKAMPLQMTGDSTDNVAEDKTMADLRKAQNVNEELTTTLKNTKQMLQEKEQLLQSVHLQYYYEVEILRTQNLTDVLIGLLKLLKKDHVECNLVREWPVGTEASGKMVFIVCIYSQSLDETLNDVERNCPENVFTTTVVLFDSNESGKIRNQEAQKKYTEYSKKGTVFCIKYNSTNTDNSIFFFEEKYVPFLTFVHQNTTKKPKVVGCHICYKSS